MRKPWIIFIVLIFTSGLVSAAVPDSLQFTRELQSHEINTLNYRAFPDLLIKFPGLRIRQTGPPGQWTDFRMHNTGLGHSQLLFDGILLQDPWSGGADLNMVPVDQIGSIGLYENLNPYGFTPHGAVLSVDPKSIASGMPQTTVVYRFGSDKFSNIGVTFGQQLTRHLDILSGVTLQGHGEELPTETYKGQNIYSRINLKFDTFGIRYTVMNNQSDINLPYTMFIPGDTLHHIINLPHRKTNRTDQLLTADIRLGPHVSEAYFQYSSLKHEFRDYDSAPKITFPASLMRAGIRQTLQSPLLLSLNLESRWRRLTDPDEKKLTDRTLQGALQACFQAGKTLDFQAGITALLDDKNHLQTALAGRLGMTLFRSLEFRLGYHEGIREGSLGEKYSMPVQTMPPYSLRLFSTYGLPYIYHENTGLKSEHSRTGKVTLSWQGPLKLNADLNGYVTSIRDVIEPRISGDSLSYTNSGTMDLKGVHLHLNWGPLLGFSLDTWLAYSRSLDDTGSQILERPTLTGWGALTWRDSFFEDDLGVLISFSAQFCTDSWSVSGQLAEDPGLYYLNPYFLLHGKICLTIMQHADIIFALDNISGSDAELLPGRYFPVQSYRVGISWTVFD